MSTSRQEYLMAFNGTREPIDDNPPAGFHARQVIHRELSFAGGTSYRFIDKPQTINQATWPGIETYVRNLITHGYTPGTPDRPENNPLGIPVRADSYIILYLTDPAGFYQYFSNTDRAVELGMHNELSRPARNIYGEIRHYDLQNDQFTVDPCDQCRYVYFSAAANAVDGYVQKLFFNMLDRRGVTVGIDPDVRYPGNGGVMEP